MKIRRKITYTSIGLVLATVVAIVLAVVVQRQSLERSVAAELDQLTRERLRTVATDVYHMAEVEDTSIVEALRHNLSIADLLLADRGGFTRVGPNQIVTWTGTDQYTGGSVSIALPAMRIAGAAIDADPSVDSPSPFVDLIAGLTGGSATVFQRMNAEGDMIRVATTVTSGAGSRAIGTYIPRRMSDGSENGVIAAVMRGESYTGRVFVVNGWYLGAYRPLYDEQGEILGMLFVGTPHDGSPALRRAVAQIVVGNTGRVMVLRGTGDQQGAEVVTRDGASMGRSLWDTRDESGEPFVQSILRGARSLPPGAVALEGYTWKDPGETVARRRLVAAAYFEPWDWVIMAVAAEDEFLEAGLRVSQSLGAMLLWTAITAAASAVGAVFVGALVARGISLPLTRVTAAAARMAQGDFAVEMGKPPRDEVGDLVRAFSGMAAAQTAKAQAAHRLAQGDLRGDPGSVSEGDTLGKALQRMTVNLKNTLIQFQSAAEQVSAGAEHVAQSSQALSQGATEQASTLEEVSSALVEVNAQARKNAEAAGQANDLAQASVESAARGSVHMQKLVDAMERIDTSAKDITKVVKLIDDIAFQINLLALNANVEAARAGKYGKGFAVVADEVRRLAVRSAEAVKDTTHMVEEATSAIGSGAQIAQGTADQLAAIMESISKAAELLGDISRASAEQARGVEQINLGLAQVDQVTQSNAASAEQSAAAAMELSSQSRNLGSLIEHFTLAEDPD